MFAGRRKIFSDTIDIDETNIESVITDTMKTHLKNVDEIKYLFDYERGITPIADREKSGRSDVNYKINENHASEIKTFKVGYVFSDPITFVQRATADNTESNKDDGRVAWLNEMMFEQGKAAKDKQRLDDIVTKVVRDYIGTIDAN